MGIRPLTALSRSVAPQGHRRLAGDETGAVDPLPGTAPAPKESLLSLIPPEGIRDTLPWFSQYGRGFILLDLKYPRGVHRATRSADFWPLYLRAHVNSGCLASSLPGDSPNNPDKVASSAKTLLSFILTLPFAVRPPPVRRDNAKEFR